MSHFEEPDKLFVERDESIADVIERIAEIEAVEIRVVVPKHALIAEAASNFRLLAREADALEKRLTIESVDEEVLSLSKRSKLTAIHPLFEQAETSRHISDIVEHIPAKEAVKAKKIAHHHQAAEAVPLAITEAEDEFAEEKRPLSRLRRISRPGWRSIVAGVAMVLLIMVVAWGVGAKWGRADIVVRFRTAPWQEEVQVAASVQEKTFDPEQRTIPLQFIEVEKSVTQFFPASGKREVTEKAKGTLTIYNAYSSQAQGLVATTRFATPEGKIYRLDSKVTVPGAEIKDGKIVSSSIKVSVTADKPGESYNTGPVAKLLIPGFSGTPKYDGFYGALEEGAKGGLTGLRAVPTNEDIDAGKKKVREILEAAFRTTFVDALPQDLRVLPEALSFEIAKFTVSETADAEGQFGVFGSAKFKALALSEGQLAEMFLGRTGGDYAGWQLRDLELKYSNVRPDFAAKTLSFLVYGKGTLAPPFNGDEFAKRIAGKKDSEARKALAGLTDLIDAKLSLRPSWMRRVPANTARIHINVE